MATSNYVDVEYIFFRYALCVHTRVCVWQSCKKHYQAWRYILAHCMYVFMFLRSY
jgi:hypothetical protein